jgi:DNA-binding NarL/FixJ family response regulator
MIRVLIVAEVRFYRDGLADNLGRYPGLTLVGAMSHREDPEARVSQLEPDVLLLDTATPDGLGLAARVSRAARPVKVVALAVSDTESDLLAWAEAGVSGFVPSDSSLASLVAAIEACARGELQCSPSLAGRLLRRVAALAGAAAEHEHGWDQLTRRERQILELVARGLSNKQIARQLGIELATAKNHIHRIFEKLRIHSRVEAVSRMRERAPLAVPSQR